MIFAVKSGDYSDQIIHCLFTDERYIQLIAEAEQAYDAAMGWNDPVDTSRYRILPLQLWDVLPVVEPASHDEQRQSDV